MCAWSRLGGVAVRVELWVGGVGVGCLMVSNM